MPRDLKTQHDEDLARLVALRDSGSLEEHEAERFADVFAEFEAKSLLHPTHTLSPKQRSMVDDAVRALGLHQPSFSSGKIPLGKPVDALAGVPVHLRKPLRPPGRR